MSENPFEDVFDDAEDATNEAFASNISSLTRMMDDEIEELAPETTTKKRLCELLEKVKNDDEELEGYEDLIIKLIKRYLM